MAKVSFIKNPLLKKRLGIFISIFLLLALAGVTYFIVSGKTVSLFSGAAPNQTIKGYLVKSDEDAYAPCKTWHDNALSVGLNADYGLIKASPLNPTTQVCVVVVIASSSSADKYLHNYVYAKGTTTYKSQYRLLYATGFNLLYTPKPTSKPTLTPRPTRSPRPSGLTPKPTPKTTQSPKPTCIPQGRSCTGVNDSRCCAPAVCRAPHGSFYCRVLSND